jgi:cytochrome P450
MLLDYYYKYGDVFELVLKGRKVFFVADAEVAKRILKDGDVFRRNKRLGEVTRGMLDGALFVIPTGPTWYRHRKLLQPAFGPSHLHDVARVTNERMDLVVDHWTRLIQEDSIVVDLYKNISSITIDVM